MAFQFPLLLQDFWAMVFRWLSFLERIAVTRASFGGQYMVEFKSNGKDIPVTKENIRQGINTKLNLLTF